MNPTTRRTILLSAPKRSGGSLLTRLFDNHPGVIDFVDEGFFWEHAYHYHELGLESLFVDMFKVFTPQEIVVALGDRQLIPRIEGKYIQVTPKKFELDMNFNKAIFAHTIEKYQAGLTSINHVWYMLVEAYALAMNYDLETSRAAFLFGGDYGRGMLTAGQTLADTRNIFLIRNPFYSLESLKKSRLDRGEKILHPINFIESMSYYFFFWDNKEKILDKNTILIRYEDLLVSTEATMKKVADHVGVEFTQNLLTPSLRGDATWGGDSSFEALKGVDKSVLNRKIKTLDKREIDLIAEHLKPILEFFDYRI